MKHKLLKEYFGYSDFRDGQEEIIDSILSGRDTFGIMPTGAGKSVCFQIPALCMEGITLVISPLISLMIDQVQNLGQAGIRGAYLNSALTYAQYRKALYNASRGMYKIIYVAPERLVTEEFLQFAKAAPISMITIDEAHCVSQWGHDFRASYLKIREFIDALPKRPVISAFTATATKNVWRDVIDILGLQNPKTVTTGFDRKNLFFSVQSPRNKKKELLRLIGSYGGKAGIVYCSTRKNVENVCDFLRENGCEATRYHAGLDEMERKANQDDFIYERKPIMVATNAFGMGIDKSNVAYVIHYNMPKNMESYYQEAGRAGRDGSEAVCTILYSSQDIITNRFLIDNSENPELDTETQEMIREQDRERLRKMIFYCTTAMCLRTYILRYFGEDTKGGCGKCSNCVEGAKARNAAEEARKIAACVDELGGRYGQGTIIEVLRGEDTDRADRYRMADSYATLRGTSVSELKDIITAMRYMEYLTVAKGDYPLLQTTRRTKELFNDGAKLLIKEKISKNDKKKAEQKRISASRGDINPELFERLRQLRARFAKIQGVPPFVVFSDATLEQMCRERPKNLGELLDISGVGMVKADRYGDEFIKEIREFQQTELPSVK